MTIKKAPRYALIAVLLLILCNYPLLSTANKPILVAGIPLLYVYIAAVWLLGIILLYVTANSGSKNHE